MSCSPRSSNCNYTSMVKAQAHTACRRVLKTLSSSSAERARRWFAVPGPGQALSLKAGNVMNTWNSEMVFKDYVELDSTNAEARQLVDKGESDVFVVSTRRQTAGRGRYGRVWHAPADNLAMTIAAPRPSVVQDFSTLSLMTGVVIHGVLQKLISDQAAVRIKWPNDVVVDDAKISGTLIEIDTTRIYVGIGVNLVAAPSEAIYPTTSLGRFHPIERLDLIEKIANSWFEQFQIWARDGFASIAEVYTNNIWRRGEFMTIALNEARTERVEGRCLGVDSTGLLLLEKPDGEVRSFSTGDVGI